MNVAINPRGNGACPICIYNGKCLIHQAITESLEPVYLGRDLGLVIYNCAKFRENSQE